MVFLNVGVGHREAIREWAAPDYSGEQWPADTRPHRLTHHGLAGDAERARHPWVPGRVLQRGCYPAALWIPRLSVSALSMGMRAFSGAARPQLIALVCLRSSGVPPNGMPIRAAVVKAELVSQPPL
jgi:hypothetical protein